MVQYTSYVDVHLILARDNHVLLALRNNTGYADGQWNLPSGKLDKGEDLAAAMIRESIEELDLRLGRTDIHLVTTVHNLPPGSGARVGLFFEALSWAGEPVNAEPHKCSAIKWFPVDALPNNTVPYSRRGIEQWVRGESFGLLGWPGDAGSADVHWAESSPPTPRLHH